LPNAVKGLLPRRDSFFFSFDIYILVRHTNTNTMAEPVKEGAAGKTGKPDLPPKGALMGAGSGLREGLFGFGCGVLYGMTSPLIGHPFDTVKTKMQAQARHPSII
jgi:hypothetical protein